MGDFVKWQVRPAAVRLFQEWGIAVHELSASQADAAGLGDRQNYRADIRKARSDLGLVPQYSIQAGLLALQKHLVSMKLTSKG